jgi:light-harvesting complex 1 alpha chain
MAEIQRPKNPEDDWKIWLVLNPATWLVPILAAVLVIALAVHNMVFSLPEYSWGTVS